MKIELALQEIIDALPKDIGTKVQQSISLENGFIRVYRHFPLVGKVEVELKIDIKNHQIIIDIISTKLGWLGGLFSNKVKSSVITTISSFSNNLPKYAHIQIVDGKCFLHINNLDITSVLISKGSFIIIADVFMPLSIL